MHWLRWRFQVVMLGTSGGVYYAVIFRDDNKPLQYKHPFLKQPVFPSISFSGVTWKFPPKSSCAPQEINLDMTCEATKVIQLGWTQAFAEGRGQGWAAELEKKSAPVLRGSPVNRWMLQLVLWIYWGLYVWLFSCLGGVVLMLFDWKLGEVDLFEFWQHLLSWVGSST